MTKCSTDDAPWFIIPANQKWFRNLAISEIVVETLESMKMKMPQPSVDINEIRKLIAVEKAKANGGKPTKSAAPQPEAKPEKTKSKKSKK